MTDKTLVKLAATAAAVTVSSLASAANWEGKWVNGDNILNPGTTIQAVAANSNKNSYTSNPALNNNAWGMQGTWLSFNVPKAGDVAVTLSSATTNAPGFTVYRTDGAFTGNGTGTTTGTNGAIHGFNQVAQAGTPGIVWATDDSVTNSLPGNTTANGIVETLGYVNASPVSYVNGYGSSVASGAYDLSIDNRFENGVYGSVATLGSIVYGSLNLINLAPGYYTIFLGGTETSGSGTSIDVKVSSIAAAPSDCLFNWAESTYPQMFAPAGGTSQTGNGYYYRNYSTTNSYLGISQSDDHVYYSGPGGNLQDMGTVSSWLTKAGCN